MNLIPVLVLCCAYVRSGDGWFFHQYQRGPNGRSSDEQPDEDTEVSPSGKEIDWETRGKILFATEIITTTEMTEIPDNSTLDFEDDGEIDNITEIIELIASSPSCSEMTSSSPLIPRLIKISSPQKVTITKNRNGTYKANSNKRQAQKRRLRRNMINKKSLRNVHKSNKMKFGKNHAINEKLKRYNTHITSLELNNTKDNQRDNMVLDQDEQTDRTQNKNSPQTNENYKGIKRKREVPLKSKINYLDNNIWETPTCEIMGDGVDHVCVQYAQPIQASSYHRPGIYPTNYEEERKEVKTIDLLEKTNNVGETMTDKDFKPDLEQYKMKMYNSIKSPKTHINNFMNSRGKISQTGADPFEILKKSDVLSKNPELLEDNIYTNYSRVDKPSQEDILIERRIKPFKSIQMNMNNEWFRNASNSNYVVNYRRPSEQIMHSKKNSHKLPMNITIAMMHLLKHYNPTDLNISNSSFLTPDGTLNFSIELRKGSGKDV